MAEPLTLAEAKTYLRVLHTDEDAKITAMIPRARKWVEDHTGLALEQRTFVERHRPVYGTIRLNKGPLASITSIAYIDLLGSAQTYTAVSAVPSTVLHHSGDEWPAIDEHGAFTITYVAGYGAGLADERLIGAMLALIEGEYAEGYAYPARAVEAAERCCGYLRTMVA